MVIRHILPIVLLPFACAKVTTNYPGIDGGPDSGGGGNAGGAGTGGFATSISVGGTTAATGGARATGGVAAMGGVPATGGSKATGGTSTVAGTGGAPATGGSSPVTAGDAGTSCAAGFAFCDDFEAYTVGGPASQWTATTGTWSVATDTSETAGDQKVYSNKTGGNASSQAGTGTYTNATIEARMKVTSFSSNSSSNAAGIFLRGNGTNDYDLSLGGDGLVYLRRTPTSSTGESCSSGANASSSSVVTVTSGGSGWFRLKLVVTGTVAAGITITGWVDSTGGGAYTQVLQCTQSPGAQYMYDTGTAGVFSKGNAPAQYDNVIISIQ